ncbi:MAG TPA: hypothetical protein DD727_00655, partial [Clostridiales bacterium]|nr:hypothetical protein [Clostridiales bacterium]
MDERECQHLNDLLGIIHRQLSQARTGARKKAEDGFAMQTSFFSEMPDQIRDFDDLVEISSRQMQLDGYTRDFQRMEKEIVRLEKMSGSPWFARIDFKYDKSPDAVRQIYIGMSGLISSDTGEILIYDWRAPVSGMFYDFGLGRAWYRCPAGMIHGEMLLKRQYRIRQGKLEAMFDTDLAIGDDILQEILGRSADGRMRTIVNTIQREQNRIIREDLGNRLLVHGPAGSGKTSVALHRLAYLLYNRRDTLKPDQVLVLSPGKIFSAYISGVLPELGEEAVKTVTFTDLAGSITDRQYSIEEPGEFSEVLFKQTDDPATRCRRDSIRLKTAPEFLKALETYAERLIRHEGRFLDLLSPSGLVLSAADSKKLYDEDYSRYPMAIRLEKLKHRLLYLLEPLEEQRVTELKKSLIQGGRYPDKEAEALAILRMRQEFSASRKTIDQMTAFDTTQAYRDLFARPGLLEDCLDETHEGLDLDSVCAITTENLDLFRLFQEDAAGLALLKCLLGEMPEKMDLKHAVIDEIQDYTPVQLSLMARLFRRCGLTALGDLNQSLYPWSPADYGPIREMLGQTQWISLDKSYRSTEPISRHCAKILENSPDTYRPENPPDYVTRSGEEVETVETTEDQAPEILRREIRHCLNTGYASIAVICRNQHQCL